MHVWWGGDQGVRALFLKRAGNIGMVEGSGGRRLKVRTRTKHEESEARGSQRPRMTLKVTIRNLWWMQGCVDSQHSNVKTGIRGRLF